MAEQAQAPVPRPDPPGGSLRTQAVRGGAWNMASAVLSFGVQFGVGIVLARLLPPADFGLIGVAMVVIGFGRMFVDLGLGQALVQQEEATPRHIRTGFTVTVGVGALLSATGFVAAPLVAAFFRIESVTEVVRALSPVFLFAALGTVARSLLSRRLDFKTLFVVDLFGIMGGGAVSVGMALSGCGVWSIVAGTLIQTAVTNLAALGAVRHPLLPLVGTAELRSMAGFSTGVSLQKMANYVALQGDFMVAGRLLGATPLGLYTRAYQLMRLPHTYFNAVLSRVLFPALSRIQSEPERVGKALVQTLALSGFVTAPLYVLLVVFAEEVTVGLFGEAWTAAVPSVRILGAFGFFRTTYNVAASVVQASGRSLALAVCTGVYMVSVLVFSWLGATWYGIEGVAWGVGAAILIMAALSLALAQSTTNTSWPSLLASFRPPFAAATVVAVAGLSIKGFFSKVPAPDLVEAMIGGGVGLAALALASLMLPGAVFDPAPRLLFKVFRSLHMRRSSSPTPHL